MAIGTHRRTGNFGANLWGGVTVHLEVNAPHGGYLAGMGFSVKVDETSIQNVPKTIQVQLQFRVQ